MSTDLDPSDHSSHHQTHYHPHDTLFNFSTFIQQLHEYASMHYTHTHAKLSITDLATDRFTKLESINNSLEQLQHSCSIIQADKMDCLEEGLKAIKLIQNQGTKKAGKPNLRERDNSQIMKVGLQKEMNLIQKLTDLLLQVTIPNELTSKFFQQLLEILLEMFFSLRDSDEPKGKQKGRRKELQNAPIVIEYCLMSGRKINLPWLILFRVLQKKLAQVGITQQPISKEEIAQSMDKMGKIIKTVINFVSSFNDPHTVFKNLLNCLCENINETQLPIIPLFLHIFYQQISRQFKDTYVIHSCIPAQLFLGKAIFSLENLDILCQLVKKVHQTMLRFEMEKVACPDCLCSYCGLENKQNSLYQIIRVGLPNNDNLVMRVCLMCCHQLALEPRNTMEIMLFAPLIFSRFWNHKNNPNIEDIRSCLIHLLGYHGYAPTAKKKSNKVKDSASISIAESVAMNNVQQQANINLITGLYSAFLFNHSILSIKNVIYQAMNLLLICINSLDEKIKERTLKMLNQSHILAFIFNQHHCTPSIYSEQITSFKQKFLAIILIKLRDLSLNIRVGALELLSSIYSRDDIECGLKVEFYQTIYREIAFSNSPDYIAKSINVIDRSLFKLMRFNNHKDLLGFIQILVQTLDFSKQCLAGLPTEHPVKAQICKLVGKLLQVIIDLSQKDYDNEAQAQNIARTFNEAMRVNHIKADNLKYAYDLLLQEAFKGGLLDLYLMRVMPRISITLIENLIYPQEMPEKDGQWQIIATNIIQLIHTIFEDVFQAKNVVFGHYSHHSSRTRPDFSVKQLRKYFFSTAFFQKLLLRKQIGGKIRQGVLIELLSISNFCRLINDRTCSSPCLKAFLKNREKWRHCIQFGTGQLFHRLQEVSNLLREQIMVCNLQTVSSQCILFININFFIHQENAIVENISKFQSFAAFNISSLISNMRSFGQEQRKDQLYASIIKTYSLITRALTILTFLVSNYQKIVFFGHFLQRVQKKNHSKRKSAKDVKEGPLDINQRKSSVLFEHCYELVVQALQVEFAPASNDQRFQGLFKSQLLLLNSYWQLNPELILTSSHLLKQLITNTESGQTKGLYKLFLSLLPCTDMRILSIINHNFTISFPTIFQQRGLREDKQLLEQCFQILQHMLRSGMTSLCGMNGYVFCGLMHPSETIAAVATEIVREIYTNEASQRMLFTNFMETLSFLFQFYFECDPNKIELPTLQPHQVEAVKMIANITRPQSKCLLVREKRELRLKPSFVKKISQIISEKKRLMHDEPLFLIFLLRLVKSQDSFDYSELYEILYAVNRISLENFSFMEHLRDELQGHQQWPHENINKSMRIYLAYRELLSCTAYLSGCQPVKQQLKNYDKLFQSCPLPYITLKEDIPIQPIDSNASPRQLLPIVAQDVQILQDVLAGAVECVVERRGVREEDCSNTNQTKPKAKHSKIRPPAVRPNRTKNTHNRVHVSAQRRKTRACTREQQEITVNSCSLARSEESIY